MAKKIIVALLTITLLTFSAGIALAIPTTFIDQGSTWQYQQFRSPDLWPTWSTAGYDSFDWGNAAWSTGQAAFGNGTPSQGALQYKTYWGEGKDMALQKTLVLGPDLLSPLTLNVASDNGFIIFINGYQVAKANSEGYTSYWEYTLQLDNLAFLSPGINLIQVLAEDHGGKTFFDLKLSGDAAPVPEPGTVMLLGFGLFGLVVYSKRRMNKDV